MFKTYTISQAIETIDACRELLLSIDEKGNVPFDPEDDNDLNQSISTLFILSNDIETELQTTSLYCSLIKAQSKLHSQKIKNTLDFFVADDKKADLHEALGCINEALGLLRQE